MIDHYCVMGNPIAHSRSPWIHKRFAELTGQTLHYDHCLVEPGQFAKIVQQFAASAGKGCNVTVPFKNDALAVAQHLSDSAKLAGASNLLTFKADGIHADNSDGVGLVTDIQQIAGVHLQGRDILLLGAGGAAAGALAPLIHTRPRRVVLANRTVHKARELALRHQSTAEAQEVTLEVQSLTSIEGTFDVIINATSTSLTGGNVPVTSSVLKPGCLALDMMYGSNAAGFLNWAQIHGANPRDGLGMLVAQAAEAFEIWRGVRPPIAQVLDELRRVMADTT